jgi:hypothetical protein
MSQSPAQTNNSKLSVKLGLYDDLRRFSVDPSAFTFSLLKATIARLFKTLGAEEVEQLQIRYQDNESDWISISSDEELAEAVHQLGGNSLLRLSLQKPNPHHGRRSECEGSERWAGRRGGCGRWGQKWSKREHQPEQQPAGCEGRDAKFDGWKCKGREFGRGKYFYLQHQGASLMRTGNPEMIKQACSLFQEQLSIIEHPTPMYNIACCCALLGNASGALEQLRKAIDAGFCDVDHIENDADLVSLRSLPEYQTLIAQMKSSTPVQTSQNECKFKSWRRVGKYRGLLHRGLKLMESGSPSDFQSAKSLFEVILNSLVPNDAIALYNIACCEAQLGNSQAALVFLQKAISAGYNNFAHMEADADFASIREIPEFKALIATLKSSSSASSGSVQPLTPTPVQPSEQPTLVPVPSPVAAPFAAPDPTPDPTPAPASLQDSTLKTLESMGFTDRKQNLDALGRASGDLVIAVQILLNLSARSF